MDNEMTLPRTISRDGIKLIKHFEGMRLRAYQDSVGVWTIGYGHTRTAHSGMTVTEAEAEDLLREDLAMFEDCVASSVIVPLQQYQFDALVSFAFNLGCGALRRSTLLRKLNQQMYDSAADEFKRWVNAGGRELRGLVRRRKAEAALFRTGELSL